VLTAQQLAGVPAGALRLIPQSTAQALVAEVNNAPPEGRAAALAHLATMIQNMPPSVRLPDGTRVSPGPLLARSLIAAGLDAKDAAALNDFGDRPAALGVAMAAITDSTLAKPGPDKKAEKNLAASVATAMKPWLAQQAHLPMSNTLNQGRLDLATLMARRLVGGGMDPVAAANAAAKLFAGDVRDMGTWAMPSPAADARAGGWAGFWNDGAGLAKTGAAILLNEVVGKSGANLAGNPVQQSRAAIQASHTAQWRTLPDNSGLQLYLPQTDGSFAALHDKFGRTVTASWADLQAIGRNGNVPPGRFAPPPGAATAPGGQPVPVFSRQAGFNAVIGAQIATESSGRTGLVANDPKTGRPMTDPDAPRGLMQIRPSTAAPYAQSLFHAPLDLNRLLNDADYSSRIGRAAMADRVTHYGPTPGGLTLAIADYYAGPGNLQRMIGRYGDPRQPGVSIDQWLDRVSAGNPATGDYVRKVSRRAFARLAGGG
jgi:hypothetical protein